MKTLKEIFSKKQENWVMLKDEYEYQQSLMDQTNDILKRRISELEKLLQQNESKQVDKEMEIENLRTFIGQRKDLEKEFQKSFKFLGKNENWF